MTVIRECPFELVLDCLNTLEAVQGNDASRVEINFSLQHTTFRFGTEPNNNVVVQFNVTDSLDQVQLAKLLGPKGLHFLKEEKLLELFDRYQAKLALNKNAGEAGTATVDELFSW